MRLTSMSSQSYIPHDQRWWLGEILMLHTSLYLASRAVLVTMKSAYNEPSYTWRQFAVDGADVDGTYVDVVLVSARGISDNICIFKNSQSDILLQESML